MEYPLASPVPTRAPNPRDVSRKLLEARQNALYTCGWVDGQFSKPITCPAGEICGQNTLLRAVYCCPSASFSLNSCGVLPTTCLNSTDVARSCTGACLTDYGTVKCSVPGLNYCETQLYNDATLSTLITGWACASVPSVITVFDRYSLNGGVTTVTAIRSTFIVPSSTSSVPTTPTNNQVVTPPTSFVPSPVVSGNGSSLAGGVIAGIAVGATAGIAIIIGLLALLCMRERRHRRQRNQNIPQPPAPMAQTPASAPAPPTNAHSSMMSMPSATSATPLTQNNVAQLSHPNTEISPDESASHIGGYNSTVSQTAPPTYHTVGGSSPEHSGLGPLPGSQYPVGAGAFPHANTPSVMSPGSAFGSMPPGHAPSVTSHRPAG